MDITKQEAVELYRLMLVSRAIEEKLGVGRGGWHSAIGEEAVHVGSIFKLRNDDVIAPHFRGLLCEHYIKGLSAEKIFASLYGRTTGPGRGKGLGGCIGTLDLGIIPEASTVLAAPITFALGAALAAKLKGEDSVAVTTFGDGSSNRGEFHESLNFASIFTLPIVFVCINNGWAISTPVEKSVPTKNIADRAASYNLPGVIVDGNDVLAVHEAVQEAVGRARRGNGPTLIECKTYRLHGHWDADPALYRSQEEVDSWWKKCPLKRLREHLISKGTLNEQKAKDMEQVAIKEIEDAYRIAWESPRHPTDEDFVLAQVFAPQFEGGKKS
ncbi:thiamine pyrophosphate-dependent dehydrogenase E1 component subunit alpha [Chloroflexota bacterium]